ncbi:hypothetical protein DFH28DRAFT_979466 [Melampsora americana]|nr:hypothetical protein DFH28DRAFT_979466 [Melampsora americana]
MLYGEMEHQLLFNSLSGMVAGALPASWMAGMAVVEGIRAAQDLYGYPSLAFKAYIVSLVPLSIAASVLFGAILHHHVLQCFADFDSVDRIYPLLRYHFVLCRICVLLNHMQFSHGAFKVISRMHGLYLPLLLMMVVGFLVLGSGLASGVVVYDLFHDKSYSVIQHKLVSWQMMFFTECACDLGLTIIRAVYMYKANDIKAVTSHAGHFIRYVADICLLASRTPIYNAFFAFLSLCIVGRSSFGTRYFLVFAGSQLALLAMFAFTSHTFSYLTDKPENAPGTSDREPKSFPEELFAFNSRMHDSRLDAQRIARTRRTPATPIDNLFEDDNDEFASDGIRIEADMASPESQSRPSLPQLAW